MVCARFFFTSSIRKSDRYVRQIDRSMKTFYNFCNFNILGILQFKFNSPIVLLHILSQSTCLNRLISIEYKNKWNILIISNLWCTYERCTFCITNWKSFSTAPRSIECTSDRFFNFVTGLVLKPIRSLSW